MKDNELTPRQKQMREEFVRARGYWPESLDEFLLLDPDFFELFLAFSNHPWRNGVLEPKIKELIYIAIDASTTHLFEPGLRTHIRNALKLGATKDEILEVLQVVSVLGMHTCTVGLPILAQELEAVAPTKKKKGNKPPRNGARQHRNPTDG